MFVNKEVVSLKDKIGLLEEKIKATEESQRSDRRFYDLREEDRTRAMAAADKEHQAEMNRLVAKQALEIEAAKNEIRKDMQKNLVESDLKRVAAESSLAAYEKIDTKTDRDTVRDMLKDAIAGLAKQVGQQVIVTKA